MKRYMFVEKYDRKGNVNINVFRIKNNNIQYVTNCEVNTASRRGGKNDAFNALMECGEIPKKYYKSSGNTGACGNGYFYGEVTKHYDIVEAW